MATVAEADIEAGFTDGRLCFCWQELQPVAFDLTDPLADGIGLFGGSQFEEFFQQCSGPWVLCAIHVFPDQQFEGSASGGVVAINDGAGDCQKIEFVGQCEAFDTCCQSRLSFAVFECQQGGFLRVRIAVGLSGLDGFGPWLLRCCAGSELLLQEFREPQFCLAASCGVKLCDLVQRPAPAFAIGGCGVPCSGQFVEHGLALFVDGCGGWGARSATAKHPRSLSGFRVRQFCEVGQQLQFPWFRGLVGADLRGDQIPRTGSGGRCDIRV